MLLSGLTEQEALDQAWQLRQPRGLLRGQRIEAYARGRLLEVLKKFSAREQEYREKSGARIFQLESPDALELTVGDVRITGRPDRIDETKQGLFIMDYKTSADLPSGQEMVGLGYRLQLPFYALAAQEKFRRQVIGAQFIELNPDGRRTKGIFFADFNGKDPGKLTALRSNSTSLMSASLEETWRSCQESIARDAAAISKGLFEAKPKKAKECDRCDVFDLCGRGRLIVESDFA
jgi:RecB family exonuclease